MPTNAEQLADRLRRLGGQSLSWEQAARLGVELVDYGDANPQQLHLADGALVARDPTGWEWTVTELGRSGIAVRSGTTVRVHNLGIDDTARIHPTATIHPSARIEAGASIGPHTHIGAASHIGRGTIVFRHSWIGDGAYIGTGSKIRGASHIGAGTIIGTGSDIGSCSRLAAGSVVAPGASIEPFTNSTTSQHLPTNRRAGTSAVHAAQLVERLATMNRAD